MKLTRDEKEMLDGARGAAVQKAMELLVEFGEGYGAERMVDVSYAHADAGQVVYHAAVEHIEKYYDEGVRVCIPSTTEVTGMDMEQWEALGVPDDYAKKQKEVDKKLCKMGFDCTYTCEPYLCGYIPPKGSHISSCESSNQTFMNSVLGARTNRDGGQFVSLASITGKYPEFGYHLDENRKGTHWIEVEAELKDSTDYGLLGWHVSKKLVGVGIPVLTGLRKPTLEDLKQLSSTICLSAVALYHAPGITAEAQTLEQAFHGQVPKDKIVVTQRDIDAAYEHLTTAEDPRVHIVDLGCPHYTLKEIRRVAGLVEGKRKHPDVTFNVWTNRTTKMLADHMGYTRAIEEFGGNLFCDSCMTSCQWSPAAKPCPGVTIPERNIGTYVTDSVKHSELGPKVLKCRNVLRKVDDCVRLAVTGKWQ